MKKTHTLLFALGLSMPVAAMAQTQPLELTEEHFLQLDVDKSGQVSEVEYMRFMDGAFTKLDTDGNGRLSPKEAGTVLSTEQFKVVDADGNGELSRQEFQDQAKRDFHQADNDGDGQLRYP